MSCPHKISHVEHNAEIGGSGIRQNLTYCRLKQTDIRLKVLICKHDTDNYLSSKLSDICYYSKANEHKCPCVKA